MSEELDALETAIVAFTKMDRDAAERAIAYLHDRFIASVAKGPDKYERLRASFESSTADAVAAAKFSERERCAEAVAGYVGIETGLERDLAIYNAIKTLP